MWHLNSTRVYMEFRSIDVHATKSRQLGLTQRTHEQSTLQIIKKMWRLNTRIWVFIVSKFELEISSAQKKSYLMRHYTVYFVCSSLWLLTFAAQCFSNRHIGITRDIHFAMVQHTQYSVFLCLPICRSWIPTYTHHTQSTSVFGSVKTKKCIWRPIELPVPRARLHHFNFLHRHFFCAWTRDEQKKTTSSENAATKLISEFLLEVSWMFVRTVNCLEFERNKM